MCTSTCQMIGIKSIILLDHIQHEHILTNDAHTLLRHLAELDQLITEHPNVGQRWVHHLLPSLMIKDITETLSTDLEWDHHLLSKPMPKEP